MKRSFFTKILKGFYFLLTFILIYSCSDDFFEDPPGNRLTPEQHYNNEIDARLSNVGAFSILQDILPNLILSNGLRSDLMVITPNADLDMKQLFYHNCDLENQYIDPSDFYKIIINCNEGLKNVDQITEKDLDYSELQLYFTKSSFIGLRSWCYFNLVRLYGEAAYIPNNLEEMPDDQSLTFLSRAAVLDTIVANLSGHLDNDLQIGDNFYYNIYNKGLLGEVFLEKQMYDSAAFYLVEAVEGFENLGFKLTAEYSREAWMNIFVNSTSQVTEVMSAVPYSLDDNQENPIEYWTSYDIEYKIKPSSIIIDLYNNQVTKKGEQGDIYRGLGFSIDTVNGFNYTINKYDLNPTNRFSSHIIVQRAADLHLLYAEALNMMGMHDEALMVVNDGYRELFRWRDSEGVRGRVYLENVTVPEGTANVKNYIEDLIMQERAMELAFEGKRWFDLMRVARRRGDNSYLANKIAEKFTDPTTKEKIRTKLMDEANWYLPMLK